MKGKLLRTNLQHFVHMSVKLLISYGRCKRINCTNSGVERLIIRGGGHVHIFVFTFLENNTFLKKLITQNTNIQGVPKSY